MPFTPPSPEEIQAAFPYLQEIQFIGSGGFKTAYRALIDGSPEAFKIFKIPRFHDLTSDESKERRSELVSRISREINVLEKCSSPEIVRLGSMKPNAKMIGEDEYIIYSEEFLDGHSLRELINARTIPTEDELRYLLICLLKAIKELWSLNIVHRDIKPENVMKQESSERPFVLLDLGVAFSVIDTPITQNPLQIPGTTRYLAPEMLTAGYRKSLDFRGDLYGAALTVYEFASGVHPFFRPGEGGSKTLYRIVRERPKSLKEYRVDLSDSLVQIVTQLLRKKPAVRPSNIDLLIEQLS